MKILPFLAASIAMLSMFGCSSDAGAPTNAITSTSSASPKAEVDTKATDATEPAAEPTAEPTAPVADPQKKAAPGKGKDIAVITTSMGVIKFEFLTKLAPGTVKNFVTLANKKFYDGTRFHRVIKGFMIQGGDPNTKPGNEGNGPAGTGGPGYQIKAEFNETRHVAGIVSMARSQDPDSAGSQFFIVHQTAPHLDGQYTAFGKVIEGMDVVNKIAETPTQPGDEPVTPVIVKTIRIEKSK
jgi:peptidyl-prolyl cis-trans isomerase B (cyclophilin B)